MVDNGTQLFIAANPDGYIYDAATEEYAEITDVDFPGAVTVGYLDGYFIFQEPNSQKFWTSELLDGTQIDPLSFASAEGMPDNLVSLFVDHREVWLFGTQSVEVWYNAGDTPFPLARIQGAVNEIGCAATFSVAKMDNSLFWLGSDARGQGVVFRANGYTGQRISTHAVEYAIQSYGTISDAIAFTYQQDGHAFYVLSFPTAQKTWVFDVATAAWHERAGFANGEFIRHRANCQTFFNNEVVVGDFQTGKIYAYDLDVFADDTLPQKWLRSWRALPQGQNNLKRTAQHALQLDCESGVGLVTGQGSDPQVMLRWSDDGGHTWSNEHWAGIGKMGEYGFRAFWRRLGMTNKLRDRVYEVSGTDPVKIAIMGAELALSGTNA
jgi:outer membrane protein assembly factor BamB